MKFIQDLQQISSLGKNSTGSWPKAHSEKSRVVKNGITKIVVAILTVKYLLSLGISEWVFRSADAQDYKDDPEIENGLFRIFVKAQENQPVSECSSEIQAADSDRNGNYLIAGISNDPSFIYSDPNRVDEACLSTSQIFVKIQSRVNNQVTETFSKFFSGFQQPQKVVYAGFLQSSDILKDPSIDNTKIAILYFSRDLSNKLKQFSLYFDKNNRNNIKRYVFFNEQMLNYDNTSFDKRRVAFYNSETSGPTIVYPIHYLDNNKWELTRITPNQDKQTMFTGASSTDFRYFIRALAFESNDKVYFGGAATEFFEDSNKEQQKFGIPTLGLFNINEQKVLWAYKGKKSLFESHFLNYLSNDQLANYNIVIVQISVSQTALTNNVYAIATVFMDYQDTLVLGTKFYVLVTKNSQYQNSCAAQIYAIMIQHGPTPQSFFPLSIEAKKDVEKEKVIVIAEQLSSQKDLTLNRKIGTDQKFKYISLNEFDTIGCSGNSGNIQGDQNIVWSNNEYSYSCRGDGISTYTNWVEKEQSTSFSNQVTLICNAKDSKGDIKSVTEYDKQITLSASSPLEKEAIVNFQQLNIEVTVSEINLKNKHTNLSSLIFQQDNKPDIQQTEGAKVMYLIQDYSLINTILQFKVLMDGQVLSILDYSDDHVQFKLDQQLTSHKMITIIAQDQHDSFSKQYELLVEGGTWPVISVQNNSNWTNFLEKFVQIELDQDPKVTYWLPICSPDPTCPSSTFNFKLSSQSSTQVDIPESKLSIISEKFMVTFPKKMGSYKFYLREQNSGYSSPQFTVGVHCANTLKSNTERLEILPERFGEWNQYVTVLPIQEGQSSVKIGELLISNIANTHHEYCPIDEIEGLYEVGQDGAYTKATYLEEKQVLLSTGKSSSDFVIYVANYQYQIDMFKGKEFFMKLTQTQISGKSQYIYQKIQISFCDFKNSFQPFVSVQALNQQIEFDYKDWIYPDISKCTVYIVEKKYDSQGGYMVDSMIDQNKYGVTLVQELNSDYTSNLTLKFIFSSGQYLIKVTNKIYYCSQTTMQFLIPKFEIQRNRSASKEIVNWDDLSQKVDKSSFCKNFQEANSYCSTNFEMTVQVENGVNFAKIQQGTNNLEIDLNEATNLYRFQIKFQHTKCQAIQPGILEAELTINCESNGLVINETIQEYAFDIGQLGTIDIQDLFSYNRNCGMVLSLLSQNYNEGVSLNLENDQQIKVNITDHQLGQYVFSVQLNDAQGNQVHLKELIIKIKPCLFSLKSDEVISVIKETVNDGAQADQVYRIQNIKDYFNFNSFCYSNKIWLSQTTDESYEKKNGLTGGLSDIIGINNESIELNLKVTQTWNFTVYLRMQDDQGNNASKRFNINIVNCKVIPKVEPYRTIIFQDKPSIIPLGEIVQMNDNVPSICQYTQAQLKDLNTGTVSQDPKMNFQNNNFNVSAITPFETRVFNLSLTTGNKQGSLQFQTYFCEASQIQIKSELGLQKGSDPVILEFFFKQEPGTVGKIEFKTLIEHIQVCQWCNTSDVEVDFNIIDGQNLPISALLKKDVGHFSVKLDEGAQEMVKIKFGFPKVNNLCSKVVEKAIGLAVTVCDLKNVDDNNSVLSYNYTIGQDAFPKEIPLKLEELFKKDKYCKIQYWVSNTTNDSVEAMNKGEFSSLIYFDSNTNSLKIFESQKPLKFALYLRAQNQQKQQAYKKIELIYKEKQVEQEQPKIEVKTINEAPVFSDELKEVNIKIQQADQKSGNLEKFTFSSSKITDKEGDKIVLETKLPEIPCKCLMITNSESGFELEIDQMSVTKEDVGTHQISIILKDSNFESSQALNEYKLRVVIEYEQSQNQGISNSSSNEKAIQEEIPAEESQEQNKDLVEDVIPASQAQQATVLTSSPAPWVKQASAADMEKILEKLKQQRKSKPYPKIEYKKPVKLDIKKFSRDGKILVSFNQELIVPNFEDTSGRRMLISLESINVARDIIDFIFVSNEDSDSKPIKYYLSIEEWKRDHMTIFMNITDPLRVSQGKISDKLILVIKNQDYFTSALTGESVQEINSKSEVPFVVPRQLPKTISEEEMQSQLGAASNSMQSVVFIQLIAQVFLKGSMDELLSLYYALQFICYVLIYDIPMPSSSELLVNEIRKLIEFRILNPEAIVQIWVQDFKLEHLITGIQAKSSSDNQQSLFQELKLYILAVVLALILVLLVGILVIFRTTRMKAFQLLKTHRDKFFWNGATKSVNITYLKTIIVSATQIRLMIRSDPRLTFVDKASSIIIISIFLIIPGFFVKFLRKQSIEDMETDEFKDRYGQIVNEIDLKDNQLNRYYQAIFLARKAVFAVIPISFIWFPWGQVQLLIFLNLLYMMFYFGSRPHKPLRRQRIEFVNDLMVMMAFYHMILFSDYTVSSEMKFTFGYSYIGIIIFCFLFNISAIFQKILSGYLKRRKLLKMQKQYRKLQEDNRAMLALLVKPVSSSLNDFTHLHVAKERFKNRKKITKTKIQKPQNQSLDTIPEEHSVELQHKRVQEIMTMKEEELKNLIFQKYKG